MARSVHLIDTNILVYALDRAEPVKQARAIDVLAVLKESGLAAVSTQILAEFFNAVMLRLKVPLSPAEAYDKTEAITQRFSVIEVSQATVLEAARAARDYQISYWDAQIWATAKLNQIPYVLTEDVPGREMLEGVRFINPLRNDFDLALLQP